MREQRGGGRFDGRERIVNHVIQQNGGFIFVQDLKLGIDAGVGGVRTQEIGA